MNGWFIFFGLLAAYIAVVYFIRQRGGKFAGAELNGPLIMWRTQFGKRAIQKVATPTRFWEIVADIGIIVTWITGLAIFALLIFQLTLYFTAPEVVAESGQSPEFLVGLPGVNPLIPLWYGLAALIIALVIHEGSHGVMAYVGKIKVKNLGLLMFIVPIGAFVEPDEDDLERASARKKNRLFAAGPTSNLVLALVAGLILSTAFMGSVHLVNDGEGVAVGSVIEGQAADLAGLRPGDLMIALQGVRLYAANASDDPAATNETAPDGAATNETAPDGAATNETAPDGAATNETAPDGAATNETADNENMTAGPDANLSYTVQDVRLTNATVYFETMAQTRANDTLTVLLLREGARISTSMTLGDRYEYVASVAPESADATNMSGKGFMGITPVNVGFLGALRDAIESPFEDGFPGSFSINGGSFFVYIAYPFLIFQTGVDIFAPAYQSYFEVTGPMAALPVPVFFGIATLLYWIVWLNIMLGTFNALPAGPLDGGQMLRTTLRDRLMRHYRVDETQLAYEPVELGRPQLIGKDPETQGKLDRVQRVTSRTTMTVGLFILGLILLPLFGPALLKAFL